MKTIELTIGHNVNGRPALTSQCITQTVASILNLDAFTIIPCYGLWRGEAEESSRIEICGLTDELAETIAARIPKLSATLNQESIMLTVREQTISFISRELVAA